MEKRAAKIKINIHKIRHLANNRNRICFKKLQNRFCLHLTVNSPDSAPFAGYYLPDLPE
jgi:hypothetical protein